MSILNKLKKNNKGFTLAETLIYIAIIGMAVGAFVSFSMAISETRNKSYVIQEVQANARFAMDLMTQKIQSSTGINTASSTFDTSPSVLVLEMADTAKNPTVFSIDNGILNIIEGTNDPIPMISNETKITNLVFTNLSTNSTRDNIKIEMTVEYNNPSEDKEFEYSQNLQTAVSVRE